MSTWCCSCIYIYICRAAAGPPLPPRVMVMVDKIPPAAPPVVWVWGFGCNPSLPLPPPPPCGHDVGSHCFHCVMASSDPHLSNCAHRVSFVYILFAGAWSRQTWQNILCGRKRSALSLSIWVAYFCSSLRAYSGHQFAAHPCAIGIHPCATQMQSRAARIFPFAQKHTPMA